MNRAQASIITVVLIILMVIVAVLVVSSVVLPLIKESSDKINIDSFSNMLNIESVLLPITGGANIKVKRVSGEDQISKLDFIFLDDSGNSHVLSVNENIPNHLETKEFIFDSEKINASIDSFSIISYFGTIRGPEVREFGNRIKRDSLGVRTKESVGGLVSWWSLDENVLDKVGNNHGMIFGNPQYLEGVFGKAIYLDGIEDYIEVKLEENLKLSSSLTLSFWIYANGSSVDAGIVGTGIGNYQCTHHNAGNVYCYINSGANNIARFVDSNDWHHIVFSWDGTTNNNGMKLYVDGKLELQKTSTISSISGWEDLSIGKSSTSTNFEGLIDEVMIFDRNISHAEAVSIYNNQKIN